MRFSTRVIFIDRANVQPISVVASSCFDGLIKHSVGFRDRSISKERWRGREGVHEIHDKPLQKFEGEGESWRTPYLTEKFKSYHYLTEISMYFQYIFFKIASKYSNVTAVVTWSTYIGITLLFTYACFLLKVHGELLLLDWRSYISYWNLCLFFFLKVHEELFLDWRS